MPFQSLKITDNTRFNKLLEGAPWLKMYQDSELEFVNWYVYATSDDVEILWMNNYAIIRCRTYGRTVYLPPVCSTPEAFKDGINTIREAAVNPVIVGITPAMLPFFDSDDMLLLYDDVLAEYIYDAKALATLDGPKYHRKRNQFKQFQKKYRYDFIDYSPIHREAVLEFLERHHRQGGSQNDFRALLRALDHLDQLGLFADIIMVEERIVALSVSYQSRFGHGIILFEKAEYAVVGAYAAINTLSASKHFQNKAFISRQDDYGIPALRKAKYAYHPLYKTEKYTCIINRDYRGLYSLYRESFTDSKKYVDHFFLYQSAPEKTFSIKDHDRVVSGLHLLTRELHYGGSHLKTAFVVGAATTTQKRRQGFMTQVMSLTLSSAYKEHYPLIALSPVDQAYYEPFGFVPYAFFDYVPGHYQKKPCLLMETVEPETLNGLYDQATQGFDGYMLRDTNRWIEYMNALAQDGVLFYLIMDEKSPVGYIATSPSEVEELCLIQEICPIVKGYDFEKMLTPSTRGSIPATMIRIVDLMSFLKSIPIVKTLDYKVRVRFTDPLIAENNITLSLECHDGTLNVSLCTEFDFTISVRSLTKSVFTKEKEQALAQLFPDKEFISFDKY